MRHLSALLLALLIAGPVAGQILDTLPLRSAHDRKVYRDIVNKLKSTTMTVDWDETPLTEVVAALRRETALNFLIGGPGADLAEEVVSLKARDLRLDVLLPLLASVRSFVFQHRGGIIWITTKEDAVKRASVLRIHDVADLLYVPPDFPGPRIGIPIGTPEDLESETPEREQNDPTELVELIKSATGPAEWEYEGVSIDCTRSGRLIVRHTPAMQVAVARFLGGS